MNVPAFSLPLIPYGWEVYCALIDDTRPERISYLLNLNGYAKNWYRAALMYREHNLPWNQKPNNMDWIRAYPPGCTFSFDDLGYPKFLTVADFTRTWETGVIS